MDELQKHKIVYFVVDRMGTQIIDLAVAISQNQGGQSEAYMSYRGDKMVIHAFTSRGEMCLREALVTRVSIYPFIVTELPNSEYFVRNPMYYEDLLASN